MLIVYPVNFFKFSTEFKLKYFCTEFIFFLYRTQFFNLKFSPFILINFFSQSIYKFPIILLIFSLTKWWKRKENLFFEMTHYLLCDYKYLKIKLMNLNSKKENHHINTYSAVLLTVSKKILSYVYALFWTIKSVKEILQCT